MQFSESTPRQEARIIASAGNIVVEKPLFPAIPPSEGLHFQVKGRERVENWKKEDPKRVIKRTLIALAVGKVVTEGKDSPDMWANIHLNARPPFNVGVNVFGRNPETGYGKPVVIRDHGKPAMENPKLEYVLERYIKRCSEYVDEIQPFEKGVREILPQSKEFNVRAENLKSKKEHLIWLNEKYSLVAILKPHLSGLHLVVQPREEYFGTEEKDGFRRPWQHPKEFMEMMGIVLGSERVLKEYKINFYNSEIHFSGNWSPDLRSIERTAKLDSSYLTEFENPIGFRKGGYSPRSESETEWHTFVHGHLYATDSPENFVSLPERPEDEVPDQWSRIIPISTERLGKVEKVLQRNLTPWLNYNLMYQSPLN